MRCLVTGGAGFIGSHLADRLVANGHDVTIIDDLSSGKEENINPSADFRKADIRNSGVKDIFSEKSFDAVFHLAAQIDVRKSLEDPLNDAAINISGSINLLQNSVRTGVKKFIFISSGGVMYGECQAGAPAENLYPNPLSPYGNSKLAVEFYLNTYRETCGIDTVALRLGNVYGPRQDPHGEAGVVAIFIGAMLSGNEVKIFGDGKQVRDYVYVEDIVSANIAAWEKGAGVYNIGTGISSSVNELFGILKEKTGYDREPVHLDARPGELQESRLDVSKAGAELGWRARYSFPEGLEKTIEYFKSRD